MPEALLEITAIAAKDTFDVQLQNADGNPLINAAGVQCTVTVYGPGSKAYASASAARTQRMMDRMAAKGRLKLSATEQTAENAEFLAAVTHSITGWAHQGGTDKAAILAAYKNTNIGFISDQVQKAVGDWENFSVTVPAT